MASQYRRNTIVSHIHHLVSLH